VAGILFVLTACRNSPTVKRVVLTSSMLAVIGGWERDKELANISFNESHWAKRANSPPYAKSKYLAELAAWDFIDQLPKNRKLELVSILPGLVVGPLLSSTSGNGSRTVVTRFLKNDMPGIPALNIHVVDVRDVATAHICALKSQKAAGNRYLCISRSLWFSEISQILRKEYLQKGFKITNVNIPNFLVWCVSWWDTEVAAIMPLLGQELKLSNEKIKQDLGIEFRSVEESILEMAKSIINLGIL